MKKKMKLLLGLLLSGTIAVSSVFSGGFTAEAEAAADSYFEEAELYQEGDFPAVAEDTDLLYKSPVSTYALPSTASGAERAIYNGLMEGKESIDLSAYHVTTRDQLKSYFQNVINSSPELFYVDGGYRYSLSGNQISKLSPTYKVTGSELAGQKKFYSDKVHEIISQVDSSWSDLEKILFVHDYLAQNYEYDTALQIHDAYNFLYSGKGVCQSYTLVFLGLMQELGINVSVASSDPMNHIWNVVELDGRWYHVDVTWDDPIEDDFGLARHKYLLLSDQAIEYPGDDSNHYDWVCNYSCSDTRYDSYFWTESDTPFQYLEGNWYYADFVGDSAKEGVLYSYNFNTNQKNSIRSLGRWNAAGGGYYLACYTGLDVYNKKLYFNTASEIYYYQPETNSFSKVAVDTPSASIYGMRIEGQKLCYRVSTGAETAGSIYNYTLEAPIVPSEPPVNRKGDVDGDEEITLKDAQLVLQAVLRIGQLDTAAAEQADADSNQMVDMRDVQLILKYALKIIA